MSSFFGKLKSGTGAASTAVSSPKKPDPNAPPLTPLERMLKDAGPLRNDGSDKFYGMENYGNTCYCNSILQCLYYSPPFRENVLNYPRRSAADTVTTAIASATPRMPASPQLNGTPKKQVVTPQPRAPAGAQQKPEDKDSPEYKKKLALAAGPVINLDYQNNDAYDMPESLFASLKDIFEALVVDDRRSGILSPQKFLEVLRKENEMFRSAMHQDAHEFLNLLLNAVVESVEAHERKLTEEKESKTNGSVVKRETGAVSFPSKLPIPRSDAPSRWLQNLFEGTLTSETRCLTCENVSHRDEPFLDLSVDLEQHSSVTACLRRFSEEEMLCERNKFHCDNCGGLQEAEKRMKIKSLPKILALHLKRFKYTEDLQRLQKLFHTVVYPYHLRLFNTTDDAEDPDRIYELYAVVVHIGGGPYHGHYVAIIKTQDRGWLLFDDEMVEPVDKNYVRNFFGDRPGLACAYVLFYQETTIEAVRHEQNMEGKSRSSMDNVTGLGVSVRESDEMQRIQSATPPMSPADAHNFASLTHAMTAPPLHLNGNAEQPTSPKIPQGPSHFGSFIGSRKEKNREEKDKKSAEKQQEKERQAAEKQKSKDVNNKLAEAQKKQQADLQGAIDADKQNRVEETKRPAEKDGATTNGSTASPLGLDRFRRTKSLRFASLGKKDKPAFEPEEPINEAPTTPEKERRNRFSMRKKSFGIP